MSWRVESGVLDEGDSAGLLQDSLENNNNKSNIWK